MFVAKGLNCASVRKSSAVIQLQQLHLFVCSSSQLNESMMYWIQFYLMCCSPEAAPCGLLMWSYSSEGEQLLFVAIAVTIAIASYSLLMWNYSSEGEQLLFVAIAVRIAVATYSLLLLLQLLLLHIRCYRCHNCYCYIFVAIAVTIAIATYSLLMWNYSLGGEQLLFVALKVMHIA